MEMKIITKNIETIELTGLEKVTTIYSIDQPKYTRYAGTGRMTITVNKVKNSVEIRY